MKRKVTHVSDDGKRQVSLFQVGVKKEISAPDEKTAQELGSISDAIGRLLIGDCILVNARAGSGKTTSVVKANMERVDKWKTVVFTFNKQPQLELEKYINKSVVLRDRVKSLTYDAFAWRIVASAVAKRNELENLRNALMNHSKNTFPEFDFEFKQIPWRTDYHGKPIFLMKDFEKYEKFALRWFKKVMNQEWPIKGLEIVHFWVSRCDSEPYKELIETHYFRSFSEYGLVFNDEAQDMAAWMRDVIKVAFPNARYVCVGDTWQCINQFMGAQDPVGNPSWLLHENGGFCKNVSVFTLSRSIRCNDAISKLFTFLTGEPMVGNGPSRPLPDKKLLTACVLTRTNAEQGGLLYFINEKRLRVKLVNLKSKKRITLETPGRIELSTVYQAKGATYYVSVVDCSVPELLDGVFTKLVATALTRAREMVFIRRSIIEAFGLTTRDFSNDPRIFVYENFSEVLESGFLDAMTLMDGEENEDCRLGALTTEFIDECEVGEESNFDSDLVRARIVGANERV
jgi:hypothetical protein